MGLELDMALRITMDDTRQGYMQKRTKQNKNEELREQKTRMLQ